MATIETLREALSILENSNQRSKHVRNAAAYIRKQIASAPIQWGNFHDATRAVFQQTLLENIPQRPADFISASGSRYWKTTRGVYRLSDHWGLGIRSCDWYLRTFSGEKGDGLAVGFCAWENFHRDDKGDVHYYMVAPDGSERPAHPADYVRKGHSLRCDVIRPAIYHTFSSLTERLA